MLRLIVLVTAALGGWHVGAEDAAVRLEPFTLNLRSSSKPETGDYLVLLRKLTTTHLERKMIDEIDVVDNHVELLMKALTLDKDVGGGGNRRVRRELDEEESYYVSKATFEGSAFFATDGFIPDASILYDIQLQAFSGSSKKELMNELQSLSDEPFLANAQELSVTFGAVSGHSLDPESANSADASTEGSSSLLPVIIGVGAGAVLLIGLVMFWYFKHRTPSYLKEPRRDSGGKSETDFGKLETNPTGSPSPPPSISSMDSSKFTYNEAGASLAGGTYKSAKSKSSKGSTKSCNNTIDLNMNVDAWQNAQGDTDENLTFAMEDVSVIQKQSPEKSMVLQQGGSQIESGAIEIVPRKLLAETSTAMTEDTSYLSEDRLSKRDHKSKYQQHHSAKYQGGARLSRQPGPGRSSGSMFHDECVSGEGELGVSMATNDSDVINDLKNLSVQINRHRS